MKKRTKEEIDRQIKGLKESRESLPEYSVFGDNNWELIDIQISILTGEKTYTDYEDSKHDIESTAYYAKNWLDGSSDEDLF